MSSSHAPAQTAEGGAQASGLAARVFNARTQVAMSLVAGGLLLASACALWGGAPVAAKALQWAALAIGLVYGSKAAFEAAKTQFFDIDVLMVVAAVLAAAIGAPAEGALLLFLFVLAGGLEELAMEKTTRSVAALHKLMPTRAERWDDAGGGWALVEPPSLAPGDRIRIRPGEQIPADARLTTGRTSIDQASLTGESAPRVVEPGDEVYGGTVNVGDVIEGVVIRPAAESALSRILHLVTEAQQQREPVQRLIDRLSQPYAVGVFVVSIVVFLAWWLALGRNWQDAMYTAIGLLIVVSPCALVLATPTATLAGISRGARGGVLFKGGKAVERLARLGAVAFDKTGTLTVGRPVVRRITVLGEGDERALLAVARGLEQTSTHPISHAVVEAAKERNVEAAPVEDVKYDAGRGVRGTIRGTEARMGSLQFVQPVITPALHERIVQMLNGLQGRGLIGNVCAYGGQGGGAAVFILADAVRPGAECLVERLHDLSVRPVVMLTGDNSQTGQAVGRQLGLDEVHTEQLPKDKVDHVHRLKERLGNDASRGSHRAVGVIGDGVNDAPALAAADVSIAIGSIGSDAALENADIVLLSDDLSAVPWAVALARRVRRTIAINLSFALGAMGLMAIGVIAGSLSGWRMPLWMGVIGHEGGTLLVVAHSLLILTHRPVATCARTSERPSPVEVRIEGRPIAAEAGA